VWREVAEGVCGQLLGKRVQDTKQCVNNNVSAAFRLPASITSKLCLPPHTNCPAAKLAHHKALLACSDSVKP
jgi:hypothetical protein